MSPNLTPCQLEQVYESSERLRIGYYDNDGYTQPSPGMSRALQEAKAFLEQAGHKVFILLLINALQSKTVHTWSSVDLREDEILTEMLGFFAQMTRNQLAIAAALF